MDEASIASIALNEPAGVHGLAQSRHHSPSDEMRFENVEDHVSKAGRREFLSAERLNWPHESHFVTRRVTSTFPID